MITHLFTFLCPVFAPLYCSFATKKATFVYQTKVAFLSDVCLRQMMAALPDDVRCANDVCLAAHCANIASLRHEVA